MAQTSSLDTLAAESVVLPTLEEFEAAARAHAQRMMVWLLPVPALITIAFFAATLSAFRISPPLGETLAIYFPALALVNATLAWVLLRGRFLHCSGVSASACARCRTNLTDKSTLVTATGNCPYCGRMAIAVSSESEEEYETTALS